LIPPVRYGHIDAPTDDRPPPREIRDQEDASADDGTAQAHRGAVPGRNVRATEVN